MKYLFLVCLLAGVQALAQDYEAIESPIILFQGNGKGEDERDIQFSGSNDSDIVKKHHGRHLGTIGNTSPAIKTKGRRNVYHCQNNGKVVFADDENKAKFTNCVKISTQIEQETKPVRLEKDEPLRPDIQKKPVNPRNACTGALVYQGNTYVFSEEEACPIPPEIFQHLRN